MFCDSVIYIVFFFQINMAWYGMMVFLFCKHTWSAAVRSELGSWRVDSVLTWDRDALWLCI